MFLTVFENNLEKFKLQSDRQTLRNARILLPAKQPIASWGVPHHTRLTLYSVAETTADGHTDQRSMEKRDCRQCVCVCLSADVGLTNQQQKHSASVTRRSKDVNMSRAVESLLTTSTTTYKTIQKPEKLAWLLQHNAIRLSTTSSK